MNASLLKSAVRVSLFVVLISFLHGCKTAEVRKIDPFKVALDKSNEYLKSSNNDSAEIVLLEAAGTRKPQPSPYHENGVLICYGNIEITGFFLKEEYIDKSEDNTPVGLISTGTNSDNYDSSKFDKIVHIKPYYPQVYFQLGKIYSNEKNYTKSIQYIDTAIYIWHEFEEAWDEQMNNYLAIKDINKAKETGQKFITDSTIYSQGAIRASILRKLGKIAVQENDLDNAEKYYTESLKLNYRQSVRQELNEVLQLKRK